MRSEYLLLERHSWSMPGIYLLKVGIDHLKEDNSNAGMRFQYFFL